MIQLYMFYIGGSAGRSNIELHDIQFVACEHEQQAIPYLKEVWFGDKDKIHIDGWQIRTWADGYDIVLSPTPAENQSLKLYFVNVGAYTPHQLAELHAFDLFVAHSPAEAKQKALQKLLCHLDQQHKDNLCDVDDLLLLSEVNGYYIHLHANANEPKQPIGFQGYMPI